MMQRTFDFDLQPAPQPSVSLRAEATSLPPPVPEKILPPLVRPDRQLTYGGVIHFEWPAPEHDRDTITVDRIRDDIDGPSHRFVICRGDTVIDSHSENESDPDKSTAHLHLKTVMA